MVLKWGINTRFILLKEMLYTNCRDRSVKSFSHIVTDSCHSLRSTRSGSATHCRSSAGRYWRFRAVPGVGSDLCEHWECGLHKPGDTVPAGAASPGHRSYCILTTLQYPSCAGGNHKSMLLGRYSIRGIGQFILYTCCCLWQFNSIAAVFETEARCCHSTLMLKCT